MRFTSNYFLKDSYSKELINAIEYAAAAVGQKIYITKGAQVTQPWNQGLDFLKSASIPGTIIDYVLPTNEARVVYAVKATASNGGTLVVKLDERPVFKCPMDSIAKSENGQIDLVRPIIVLPGKRITVEVEGGSSTTVTIDVCNIKITPPT